MPGEQVAALAPLQQQARPLARNALYHALRRVLNQEDTGNRDTLALDQPTQRVARVLLVEDNP
ncbi:sensor histidine kinase/response regulator, partial [Pseudomonas syringae pv. actinidiae ICMP 19101]